MATEEKPEENRIVELEELVFGDGIGGKVPDNLPDLVRELLAFDGGAETYARVIMELGFYDFNSDVVAVTDEALQMYPRHADIVAIKRIVEEIEKHEFDTVIKVGSDFKSVNRALLKERIERGVWRLCPRCRQVFTSAQVLSEDQEARVLKLPKRRADARFCHSNCRSLSNIREQREK